MTETTYTESQVRGRERAAWIAGHFYGGLIRRDSAPAEALRRYPDPEAVVRVRVIGDSSLFTFRAAHSTSGVPVLEWRFSTSGNWNHVTVERYPAPALTEDRIRLWADLLDWPLEDDQGRPCRRTDKGLEYKPDSGR